MDLAWLDLSWFDLSWMAWTWPTAAFFVAIGLALAVMTLWELRAPGGGPRRGVLGIDTTRGDRLFLTLLGSAFIFMAWLGLYGQPIWGGLALSIGWGAFTFRYV